MTPTLPCFKAASALSDTKETLGKPTKLTQTLVMLLVARKNKG